MESVARVSDTLRPSTIGARLDTHCFVGKRISVVGAVGVLQATELTGFSRPTTL
jgi:hypothetical protein